MISTFFSPFSCGMKRKCGTNLHQEDDEKVEVGDSSELFKQVLWQKVPDSVLQKGTGRQRAREINREMKAPSQLLLLIACLGGYSDPAWYLIFLKLRPILARVTRLATSMVRLLLMCDKATSVVASLYSLVLLGEEIVRGSYLFHWFRSGIHLFHLLTLECRDNEVLLGWWFVCRWLWLMIWCKQCHHLLNENNYTSTTASLYPYCLHLQKCDRYVKVKLISLIKLYWNDSQGRQINKLGKSRLKTGWPKSSNNFRLPLHWGQTNNMQANNVPQ